MKRDYRWLARFILGAALIFPAVGARAESKAIPTTAVARKNNELPAADLMLDGKPLDPDAAVDLRKRGTDLARLNPVESDVWQNKTYSASETASFAYPPSGARLTFHSIMPLNPEGWFRSQVLYGNQIFRLSIGLNTHQALARAALLRKLGYPVQSPVWMPKLTLAFADKKSKDSFIGEIAVQAGLVDHKRWVLSDDDSKNEITLQDVMLEPATITVPTSFYLGSLNATHIKDRRALRALLVPFVLVDIPENVNMFSWEVAKIVNDSVVLTHKYADAFSETTFDDMRWMLTRLASLTRDDFKQVIDAGRYPSDIAAILLEKTIARRNGLLRLFKMQELFSADVAARAMNMPYNTQVTTGYIEQGKALQEHYDGYALRFTHGDPQSPLRTDDVTRFLKIEAISLAIKQITSVINTDLLQIRSMDDLMANRTDGLKANFFKHIKEKPFEPYNQPISTWKGPVADVSVGASRNIVTGSYYGTQSSDFKVSLVDQLTASGRVGYFLGVDGIPKVFPGIGANLSVSRSYVHVRPIPSMQAADKQSWKDLWIPHFMTKLAQALEKPLTGKTAEENQKQMSENLAKFLEDLKDGETFTVTDSISLSANASLNVPLAALLELDPVNFANSVVFGANANTIILRRTIFTRDNGKIKVDLQNVQSGAMGTSFDFNWWMNIMRVSKTKKWGAAQTREYHLEEKPSEEKEIRNTILAIRGMLAGNNSEILEANFHPYELDHHTKADIVNGKFLFERWTNIEESHRVSIRPPKRPDQNFDPKKFERTLFSHRTLERTGKNYYSFLSDILDGFVQTSSFWKPGLLDSKAGENPKDSFMGSSKWSTVTTEGEVTPGRISNPVTYTEHYWAGWDLSKATLFKIIDQIDARVQSLKMGYPLVDRNEFNDVRRLQLYEIRTTFIVYEAGMARLREKLLVQDGRRGSWLQRMVGWDSSSGADKDIVNNILIPLYGQARFDQACHDLENPTSGDSSIRTITEVVHGRSYPCILPWMKTLLDLRRQYPENHEAQIKWATRLMTLLDRNVDLGKLMRWIGTENFFFQVKISGFRTRDENGDTADYTSSTIGKSDPTDRAGIFKDFASDYEITSSELNASYLSEGY